MDLTVDATGPGGASVLHTATTVDGAAQALEAPPRRAPRITKDPRRRERLLGLADRVIATNYRQKVVQDDPEAAIAFVDDDVSGVYNRRFFACAMERMWRRQRLALLFIDLDHFGRINKDPRLGYAVGDETLQQAAQIILRSSRWPAFVCRLGGDEFSVLIRKSSRDEVLHIAHRIRHDIETHVFPPGLRLTASIGIGTKPGMHSMSKDDLFAFADSALRLAKQNRNCVIEGECMSPDPSPEIP